MKVMCVGKIPDRCGLSGEPMPHPEIMDKDIVIDIVKNRYGVYYSLERFGMENLYSADYFATLPTESDEQAIEAEKEAIIYQR